MILAASADDTTPSNRACNSYTSAATDFKSIDAPNRHPAHGGLIRADGSCVRLRFLRGKKLGDVPPDLVLGSGAQHARSQRLERYGIREFQLRFHLADLPGIIPVELLQVGFDSSPRRNGFGKKGFVTPHQGVDCEAFAGPIFDQCHLGVHGTQFGGSPHVDLAGSESHERCGGLCAAGDEAGE